MPIKHWFFCEFVLAIACACAQAAEPRMDERGAALMKALNIDEGSAERDAAVHAESRLKDVKKLRDFTLRLDRIEQTDGHPSQKFVLADSAGAPKILGLIMETDSPRAARTALFKHMTMNSMPLDLITKTYGVVPSKLGDPYVVRKRFDAASKTFVNGNFEIHFVQGNTTVSLRAIDREISVEDVASDLAEICKKNTQP